MCKHPSKIFDHMALCNYHSIIFNQILVCNHHSKIFDQMYCVTIIQECSDQHAIAWLVFISVISYRHPTQCTPLGWILLLTQIKLCVDPAEHRSPAEILRQLTTDQCHLQKACNTHMYHTCIASTCNWCRRNRGTHGLKSNRSNRANRPFWQIHVAHWPHSYLCELWSALLAKERLAIGCPRQLTTDSWAIPPIKLPSHEPVPR